MVLMTIAKHQRALIVLTSLSKDFGGMARLFYALTEAAAVCVARLLLRSQYAVVVVRRGVQATQQEFLSALREVSDRPGIEAIDVFLHMHGLPCTFCFYDEHASSAALRDGIASLGLPAGRLRLLYNTGCYGDSQNERDMLGAGFTTAIGAHKVNATGAAEFPIFCVLWRMGRSVESILRVADHPALRAVQDAVAQVFLSPTRRRDVVSRKIVRGQAGLRISGVA